MRRSLVAVLMCSVSQVALAQSFSGTITSGNLVVGGGSGQATVKDSASCASSMCTMPSGLAYSGSLSYAGTLTPGWFKEDGNTVSGTSTSAAGCCLGLNAFRLYIGSDTVDASTPGTFSEMVVIDAPSAGHKGYRTAISGYLETVGSPGSGSNNNYVGVLGQNRANVNLGGTTFSSYSAGTNQLGSLFGMNANVFAQSGATFLVNITSEEFDVSLPSGASSAEKHAITIIKSAADAVQGNFDDSAIEFDDQDGTSVGWNYGISFGAYAHKWAFTSTSTLIGIQNRVVPSSGTSPANIGVDMTNGTFTTAQYKGTGWQVDPSGNQTAVSSVVTGAAPAPASGQGSHGGSATNGAVILGQGSTYDVLLQNKNGTTVIGVLDNSTNVSMNNNGAFLALGRTSTVNTGDMIAASFTNGNRAGATFTNASAAVTAKTEITLGNNTNAAGYAFVGLSSSTFTGSVGGNAFYLNGTNGLLLQGNGTTALSVTSGAVVQLPNVTTGTPAASLCIDASNNIIKKTTTGSCV